MTLEIIGTGLGRTGTTTLKGALERLGFGKCYHMSEVFDQPEKIPLWRRAAYGEPVDWEEVFAGYRATVDWPSCHFWRALAARYPDAKIIHTIRSSPEVWYRSFSRTIAEAMSEPPPDDHPLREWWDAVHRIIVEETFGGRPDDEETAIAAYNRREEEVRAAIDPSRLLVYDVAEGWEPLCRFLGITAPDEPMPKTNTTDEFRAVLAARREGMAKPGA